MRTTLLLTLLSITITSFAQKTISVKAGTTYSSIRDIEADFTIGYYAGLLYEDKIDQILSVIGDIYFIDQRVKVMDVIGSAESINLTMGVNIHVPNSGFYLTLGPEIGTTLCIKVDGDKTDDEKEFRFNYAGGLGYQFNRIGIQARYVGAIFNQQSGFDFNVQAGLTCKLF